MNPAAGQMPVQTMCSEQGPKGDKKKRRHCKHHHKREEESEREESDGESSEEEESEEESGDPLNEEKYSLADIVKIVKKLKAGDDLSASKLVAAKLKGEDCDEVSSSAAHSCCEEEEDEEEREQQCFFEPGSYDEGLCRDCAMPAEECGCDYGPDCNEEEEEECGEYEWDKSGSDCWEEGGEEGRKKKHHLKEEDEATKLVSAIF